MPNFALFLMGVLMVVLFVWAISGLIVWLLPQMPPNGDRPPHGLALESIRELRAQEAEFAQVQEKAVLKVKAQLKLLEEARLALPPPETRYERILK